MIKRFLIFALFPAIFLEVQCQNRTPTNVVQNSSNSRAEIKQVLDTVAHFKTEIATLGNGPEVNTFSPALSKVPLETVPDMFSPEKFANTTYPTSFNKDLGFYLPNWIVTMQTDLSKVYVQKRIPLRSKGIWGSVDVMVHHKEGPDWNFFVNPMDGKFYGGGISPRTGVMLGTFNSALPIEQRLQFTMTDLNNWDKKTEAQIAQMANEVVRGTAYGDHNKPWKQTIGMVDFDWENGYENGTNPRIALRFIKSACDNLQGIFQCMYVHPVSMDLGYLTKNGYPDANGIVLPAYLSPIYKAVENLDGIDYRVTDSKNFAPLIEVSHYAETTMHGFNDGIRTFNAYGPNSNIEHYLARVASACEKNYFYMHSIGKNLMFVQAKLICDRVNGWQYPDGAVQGDGNKTLPFARYLTRDQAFKSTMAVFFSGLHLHEWNRPRLGMNSDTYNGLQFALTLLGSRKIFSTKEKLSAVDMRTPQAEFHLWKSKYKFAGETTYRQEEGYKLKDDTDNLLVRTMRLGNKLAIVVLNPYNVATKFNLTVACSSGGFSIEKKFTESDWKSCYPNDARKDYIFDIIEMK